MPADDDVPSEQRKNVLLRILINDMLAQVREIHRQAADPWASSERALAEEALERIMSQVRQEALRHGSH